MPLLTVLTPAHTGSAAYLAGAAESVLSQSLPENWELEWIVQGDGEGSDQLTDLLPSDSRLRFESNSLRLGPAMTRNLALTRARGIWVQNLDADDVLLPGALATLVSAVEAEPSIHWAWGQAEDLMPDGSRVTFEPWISQMGVIPAGFISGWVEEHGGQSPMPCAAVAYRTTTLRALGGWLALPTGEDVGLLCAAAALAPGWQDPATTWLYRQHDSQTTRDTKHPEWALAAHRIALQRVSALRLTGASLGGTADETNHSPRVQQAWTKDSAAQFG